MESTFSCSCFRCPDQNQIVVNDMPEVEGMQHVEDLINYIDQLMRNIESGRQEHVNRPNSVASSINSGGNLIEELSKRLKWHLFKKCLLGVLDRQTRKVVIDLLSGAQHTQFVGMGLSIIAHLLERAEQASSNADERLHLLRHMSALAKHMKNLDSHVDRGKLDDILRFIVKATVICALQMEPNSLCRFIFAPLDAADLENLKSQLMHLYPDLQLHVLTEVLERLPAVPGPSQGQYPDDAVGVEAAQKKVMELLDLQDSSRRVVVIFGVGGIGKTTLATAVFNRLDLSGYHHCQVSLDQDCKQSDLPPKQEQILRDLFQENLKLMDCTQGREKLSEAFRKASKPVFLFIDNALRQPDLEMLLPLQHLSRLPMHSRVLVTTRNLDESKIFDRQDGIQFRAHRVDPLPKPEAKSLFCHYALGDKNGSFDEAVDVDGLLKLCGGIPLVLGIAGSELRNCGNTVSTCKEIIRYLQDWQRAGLEGGKEDLSERMVDFVYRRLRKPSQEAFLDIAFFFSDWQRSKVSDIVGEMELHDLEGAALVTTSEENVWDSDIDFHFYVRRVVVKMHDIVRARGRKMSEGNRIIDSESLVDILTDEQVV